MYGAETVEKGHTMVELHSNFTERGNTTSTDGTIPTNHQLHESLEITTDLPTGLRPASIFLLLSRTGMDGIM